MERTVICSEFVPKMDWPKDSMADSTRIDSKGRAQNRHSLFEAVPMSFTSLPSAHDLGGENPYIDTKDVLKLLNCGRLGRQAVNHPWSALTYRRASQV